MQIDFQLHKECFHTTAMCEPHFHDDYEIMLCITDGGTVEINHSKRYPMCHGMLFLIGRNVVHQCFPDVKAYEKFILHFPRKTLEALSSPQTNLQLLFDSCDHIVMLLGEELFASYRDELAICVSEKNEFGSDLRKQVAFIQMVLSLGSLLSQNIAEAAPIAVDSPKTAKLMPILEYIHQHYSEEIGLDSLCQHFYISKSYLARQFKLLTGFSVNAYITNYRIRQAAVLLRQGISVQHAGEQTGFNSEAHFSNTFKRIMGESPRGYIKSH